MFKYQFHEKWVLPLLAILTYTFSAAAQCPLTQSAAYPMTPQGIPSRDYLEPSDFFVDLADASKFTDLSISQNHFLCRDLGIQEVVLTGVDATGNTIACTEYVWVYDSVFSCDSRGPVPMVVAGKIYTETLQPVSNIAIGLTSGAVNFFDGTDEKGAFYFDDILPENYQLKPTNLFDDNIRNGLSTFDVLLLQKHVLGLRPLGSPYKIIAADLNNSGDVTAFDMLLLRQLLLGIIDEFPATPSWKFVDANHQFTDAKNPLAEDFPQTVSLNMKAVGPQLNNRFVAVKMGDLNNSVNLSLAARGRAADKHQQAIFTMHDQPFSAGQTVEVPIRLTGDVAIQGFQFSLAFSSGALDFAGVDGLSTLTQSHFVEKEGRLNISWSTPESIQLAKSESPLTLRFVAKSTGKLSENLQLAPEGLMPEIYTAEEFILSFDFIWQRDAMPKGLQVFNNYPNPFSQTTQIPFSLAENNELTLQIFDTKGQLVATQKQYFSAGQHQWEVAHQFTGTGMYFYRIQSNLGMATGRMQFIEQ